MPEDDESFQARLLEKYAEPGMFHREMLFLSRDQFDELRAELWELTKAMLDARRRGTYYRNTGFCFQYGRPCAYFPLCRSGGNPTSSKTITSASPRTKNCGTGPVKTPPRCFRPPTTRRKEHASQNQDQT